MNMFSGRVLCELTSAEDLVDCGINMSKEEANGFIAEIESLKVKGVPYRYISQLTTMMMIMNFVVCPFL